jgi:NAD(P)-dependent dehydrogenase (short-subunit alcohol dehydrogenase family)
VATPLLQANLEGMKGEIEKTPIGRLGTPEEIADSIAFMASPLSSFMYGAAMVIDGGYTIQ